MACSNPMVRIESTNGKISFEHANFGDRQSVLKWSQKLENSKYVKNVTMFPCKKCIGCRLDYAKEWANRIVLETKTTENNYFLTLTYDDEHLPKRECIDENGIITGMSNTLDKKDVQDFMKRLRIHYKRNHNVENIRYYLAGEYGSKTERAHYHAIMFNLPIVDLKKEKVSGSGNVLYTSKELTKIWGKGYVWIGEVTWNSASYVARYVMKKHYGKEAEQYYRSKGKEPEFVCMSTKPGIGYDYYEKHKEDIYKYDEIHIPVQKGVRTVQPPEYYDIMYEREFPEKFEEIKFRRKQNIIDSNKIMLQELKVTDNIQKQREIKERNLQSKSTFLTREL